MTDIVHFNERKVALLIRGAIDKKAAYIRVIAWCLTSHKSLHEHVMI